MQTRLRCTHQPCMWGHRDTMWYSHKGPHDALLILLGWMVSPSQLTCAGTSLSCQIRALESFALCGAVRPPPILWV